MKGALSNLSEKLWQKTDIASFYSKFTRLARIPEKNELKGLCPLHEERHPSFFVNLDTGSFKCFGCGKGGGPLQFYAAVYDLSFFEASAKLRGDFDLWEGNEGSQSRQSQRIVSPIIPSSPSSSS